MVVIQVVAAAAGLESETEAELVATAHSHCC